MANLLQHPAVVVCCFAVLAAAACFPATAASALAWPHPIPARIQDGANPDLFVMTLGEVKTPIADGVFDLVKDAVTLLDGTVRSNYFREVSGIKFYQPLDKFRFALPPSGWCAWYYYYSRVTADEVLRSTDWIAASVAVSWQIPLVPQGDCPGGIDYIVMAMV